MSNNNNNNQGSTSSSLSSVIKSIQGFDSSKETTTRRSSSLDMEHLFDFPSVLEIPTFESTYATQAETPSIPPPTPPGTTRKVKTEKRKSIRTAVENFRFYRPFVNDNKSSSSQISSFSSGNEEEAVLSSKTQRNSIETSNFDSDHVALSASLLYVNESDILGNEKEDRVHPFEQRSMIFEEEKVRGQKHGKRMYIKVRSTEEVPKHWNGKQAGEDGMGKVVPWKHGPSFASKWAFPQGAYLDVVCLDQPRSNISDPLEWREQGHGGVSCHSYLAQQSDAHMTTTYVVEGWD